MTTTVNNAAISRWTTNREPVRSHNTTLYSAAVGRLYVVYSYGEHWPLYIYDTDMGVWFENTTKPPSSTTSRHHNAARPRDAETVHLARDEMCALRDAGSYAAWRPTERAPT